MDLFTDWSFASGCSPPRLSTTQLPSATDRPVLLSHGDFHPTIGAYSQAHIYSRFAAKILEDEDDDEDENDSGVTALRHTPTRNTASRYRSRFL